MKHSYMMKYWISMSILIAVLLWLAPFVQAKNRSNWNLSALRGTYTFTGNAWQDMSAFDPALPKGYAPVSLIGSFTVDGTGGLTGWAMVNAGGIQFTAEFVNSRFDAPNTDGSFPISLSMRADDFGGAIFGPYSYMGVVTDYRNPLEIAFMMLGTGPGSHLELSHAKRISMKFE